MVGENLGIWPLLTPTAHPIRVGSGSGQWEWAVGSGQWGQCPRACMPVPVFVVSDSGDAVEVSRVRVACPVLVRDSRVTVSSLLASGSQS